MEHLRKPEQRDIREITIYLKGTDLAPDEADLARRMDRLRGRPDAALAHSYGALAMHMEGITQAIDDGDGRYLAWHVKSGLASIVAYEAVRAEVRQASERPAPETSV
jgi:hypothetical protein